MTESRSPSRRARWSAALLPAAALVPFVSALAAHAVGPQARQPSPREKPPALVFDQYLVYLGQVDPTPTVHAWYRFTNRGDETVRIQELKPSCGCLQPRLKKRVYQPGESGRFFVRVETAGEKPGEKEYFVNVRYADPKPRDTELMFQFTLPERKVVVQPRALIFYQFAEGKTTHDVVVTDYRRPSTLTIRAAECPSPLVGAAIKAAEQDPAGNHRTRVSVTVSGDVPPGRRQTLLTLKTDDPEFPAIRVPLMIVGREPRVGQAGPADTGTR